MWHAILLACGSSTDNFAVGTSLGISNKSLSSSTNAIISFFNAFGAYISASGGYYLLGRLAPAYATLFAALIFSYLSIDDFNAYRHKRSDNGTDRSSSTLRMKSDSPRDALRIAIPMTLNNIAGGAAGGAVGIGALTAGVAALLASFCMMKLGHVIGKHLMASLESRINTCVISGGIFASLAVMQLVQLFEISTS